MLSEFSIKVEKIFSFDPKTSFGGVKNTKKVKKWIFSKTIPHSFIKIGGYM